MDNQPQPPAWEHQLDERALKELHFAQLYARDFAHGTTGHNQLMLIAKLAEILNRFAGPVDFAEVAKTAYHAYGQTTDFKNYQGLPMPEWEALTDKIRAAWIAAVQSARGW